jgi:hypothetical protein
MVSWYLRRTVFGWTVLQWIGGSCALLGTLPFAFLLLTLGPFSGGPRSAAGGTVWFVAFGAVAAVGWTLLLWARARDRRAAAPADA